jgi:hypothetical protein
VSYVGGWLNQPFVFIILYRIWFVIPALDIQIPHTISVAAKEFSLSAQRLDFQRFWKLPQSREKNLSINKALSRKLRLS